MIRYGSANVDLNGWRTPWRVGTQWCRSAQLPCGLAYPATAGAISWLRWSVHGESMHLLSCYTHPRTGSCAAVHLRTCAPAHLCTSVGDSLRRAFYGCFTSFH